jgi:GHMP kinases C terminal
MRAGWPLARNASTTGALGASSQLCVMSTYLSLAVANKELDLFPAVRQSAAGGRSKAPRVMDEHWQHKKKRSGDMSNSGIDEWYEIAKRNGALGGKLIGAGGGFLMFYPENKRRRHAMLEQGLEEVRFRFDFEGSKTMIQRPQCRRSRCLPAASPSACGP